jgi:hypothetical protein
MICEQGPSHVHLGMYGTLEARRVYSDPNPIAIPPSFALYMMHHV